MVNKHHLSSGLLSILLLSLLLSACSSKWSIQKRRYGNGFYVSKTSTPSPAQEKTRFTKKTSTPPALPAQTANMPVNVNEQATKAITTPITNQLEHPVNSSSWSGQGIRLSKPLEASKKLLVKLKTHEAGSSSLKHQIKSAGPFKVFLALVFILIAATFFVMAMLFALASALTSGAGGSGVFSILCLMGGVVFLLLALRVLM